VREEATWLGCPEKGCRSERTTTEAKGEEGSPTGKIPQEKKGKRKEKKKLPISTLRGPGSTLRWQTWKGGKETWDLGERPV